MPTGIYERTAEHNGNISIAHLGKHHSPETRKKMQIARLKRKQELGYLNSPETREKMKVVHKRGEAHFNYKGDKVGEYAIHRWVEKNKPKPKLCEFCHKEKDKLGHTKLTLANIKNHQYTRNPNDYKWWHYSCHKIYDLKNARIKKEEI